MDGFLPPVDAGGWLEFQRKRAQQLARERIASAGALIGQGGDWIGRAGQTIDGLVPDWAAPPLTARPTDQAAEPQLEEMGPPTPSPSLSAVWGGVEGARRGVRDWATGAQERIGQLGQGLGEAIDQAQGIISQPDAQWNPLEGAAQAFPDDPNAGAKFAAQSVGRGINTAQAQSQEALDAMMGFGPQGPNLAAQALGGLDVATTPYTAPGRATTATARNLGAGPEGAALAGGLVGTFGPGGIAGNLARREALPLAGAALGGVAGVGSGLAQGRPADEIISRGLEGTQMGAGAGEFAAAALPAGLRAARGVADRFGALPADELGAVAGRGLRREASEFGIPADEFTPRDVEGRVLEGAEGTAEELRALPGAPGYSSTTPGLARTRSERPGAGMDAVREAETPYEYLRGMAGDYAKYRDFYPDFGTFYRRLAEPAGAQADGLFNELGAMWAATAAQTAPHDNLIKALQASIAARRFRELTGRLPDADELLYLLREGKAAPGMRYDRVRANPAKGIEAKLDPVLGPEGVVAEVPEAQLKGSAAKITSDDAGKIAAIWEQGKIDIPTNFKLTAFNILNALAARNEHAPWSVIDTHMFRLFGYGDEARKIKPGDLAGNPTASRYVQATVKRLADDLGWEPHQVQSALWYGAKNEISRVDVRYATMKGAAAEFAGVPEGTRVDDGTLAYSIQKAWDAGVLPKFLEEYAPQGPINELAGQARVRFTGPGGPGRFGTREVAERGTRLSGKDPVTGQKYGRFRLDMPEQEGASAWAENRGYTTTVDAGPEELQALGYDPVTGKIKALTERAIPHAVTENVDGTTSVQLFARNDAPAQEAQGVLAGALGAERVPQLHRPVLEPQQGGRGLGAPTGQAFQLDKADGSRWTLPEVQAARRSGIPVRVSPDGLSLVAREGDLPAGATLADVQRELEAAGAPPLQASAVDVRTLPAAPATPAQPGRGSSGITPLSPAAPEEAGGAQTALQRALASIEPYGAASTRGERAFDLAAGTAGGVAGAATADEDATWQERAKRFAVGSAAGALAGPTARGGLGALRGADELAEFGARGGRRRRAAPTGPAAGSVALGDLPTILGSVPLMAPSSLGANFTGGMARTLERVLGQAFELRPFDAAVDLGNMLKAVPGAAGRFRQSVARGPTAAAQGAMGAPVKGDLSTRGGFWPGALTAGVRVNAATDQFWRDVNEAGAGAVAARRGLAGGAAKQFATRAGDFATFTGGNSVVAKALQKTKNKLHDPKANLGDKAAAWFVTSTAPYIMMPERLLRATVLAPVESGAGFLGALKRGDGAAMREAGGRLGVSIGTLGVLYGMYEQGQLTGDPPQDANERRRREAQGAEWNTITLPGGKKVPTRYFGSVGMQASLVASVMDAAKRAEAKGADPGAVMEARVNELAGWALDNSYLSDLGEFLTAVGERRFADAGRGLLAGQPARAVPLLPGVLNAADPYEREPGSFPEMVEARTGLRSQVPTRIDPVTGEDQRRRGSGWSRYWGERGSEMTPEGTELARLGLQPSVLGRTEEYEGAKQTPEQRRVAQRALGSETGRAVREAMASPTYKSAKDEDKKKLLQAALREASRLADIKAGEQVARSPAQQAQRAWDAIPKYQGVDGTPDEIRRQNAAIASAKAAQAAAKKRGDAALDQWERENPRLADLALTKPENPKYLTADKEDIEATYGVQLP